MSNPLYQQVTDSILAELEKGAIPWVKPWKADSTADKNIVSQKPYQGINRLILGLSSMVKGYSNPAWGTYKQWAELGAQVKAGEKGSHICFYKPVCTKSVKQADGSVSDEHYSVLKSYVVFNAEQTDVEITPVDAPLPAPFNTHEKAESTLIKSGAMISHGGDAAFFSPSQDRIQLPNKSAFDAECNYYATAFHELVHWSGHKNRLDRDPAYAFEELIAEIGAAFLCADHAIQGELRHAGYVQSWMKALREDSKAIFRAAAMSQKACDYINSLDATSERVAA